MNGEQGRTAQNQRPHRFQTEKADKARERNSERENGNTKVIS